MRDDLAPASCPSGHITPDRSGCRFGASRNGLDISLQEGGSDYRLAPMRRTPRSEGDCMPEGLDRPLDMVTDTERLHQMGYAQELNRNMSKFSNFAISFTIISILS